MARERTDSEGLDRHGPDTLRVLQGTVVGLNGDDVFVELGPRMQGVISRRQFDEPPAVGEVYDFTLHDQEDGLWVLSLADVGSLSSWEEMERGSLVQARAIRTRPGGLELKIGPLHAFLPTSQTGLARGEEQQLVGRNVTCEVIEVDAERQRVVVSRKLVLQRERESSRQRAVDALKPGQVIQGRVTRLEPYGAFVRFGRGLEGMIHVSNLSHERVEDPAELLKLGETVDAKVLYIKQGGKRIALGLKQMDESPGSSSSAAPPPDRSSRDASRARPTSAPSSRCAAASRASCTAARPAWAPTARSRPCSRSARRCPCASSTSTRTRSASRSRCCTPAAGASTRPKRRARRTTTSWPPRAGSSRRVASNSATSCAPRSVNRREMGT